MDLRGKFSRKNDEDVDDRGRRWGRRETRANNPGEGHSGSLDASWLAPLSRQTSAASATHVSRQNLSTTLTRHRSVQSEGRYDERRSFTQRLNVFRPISANTSRTPSTNTSSNTSSSSLRSLADQAVASETAPEGPSHAHSSSTARASDPTHPPLSPLSEIPSQPVQRTNDLPVYPDQSYAVLQHQIHPNYHPSPNLRARSSHPTHHPHLSISTDYGSRSSWNNRDSTDFTHISQTAGNTPLSSPRLFSPHAAQSSMALPKKQSHLHPTHLQEPKE